MSIRVGVVMGGPSKEREISLLTGQSVVSRMDRTKYLPIPIEVGEDMVWRTTMVVDKPESPLSSVESVIKAEKVEVIFNALHGTYGEDGTVQAILEILNVPFTGSGRLASALGMDKINSRRVFVQVGLCVPNWLAWRKEEWQKAAHKIIGAIENTFNYPVIIKPADQGSSAGVSLVKERTKLEVAIEQALSLSERFMVEEYIKGKEVSCGVLGDKHGGIEATLPPTLILPAGVFFDYNSKYFAPETKEITPAPLPNELIKQVQNVALTTYQALGCAGVARTDMIINEETGKIYVLEINTLPGLTQVSLVPQQAEVLGLDYSTLIDHIIQYALGKKVEEVVKER